ncbi:MAG: protein sphX [Betaproteobacteria bacterium RIFCSPLOWO2_02_FULL_67_26]|nr:MAG: protein sphX [Betaproteobacteria bacterium RIFCSPLOWO2_02_FULL_67_26]
MNKLKQFKILGVAAAVAALLGAPAISAQAQTVKIDGSSTVYPISEAVAEEFQKSKQGKIKVTVGISGTGGGFKKFCRGETDISDASRPITAKEMKACAETGIKYVELPVAFDALTVVVNPKNTWIKEFKVEELKKMWEPGAQGKVTSWKQVNPSWPDRALKLFGPGADSGTFDYFTDAINGKEKASRGDFTASEDDNVLVQGVSRDVGGIGYFGLAYYVENKDKLKAVPIVNKGSSKAVMPSLETVMDGTYQPLARPIFIYVSDKSMARPEVKEFVEYYLAHGAKLSKEVGYVPLGKQHYDLALKNFKARKLGTGFGGKAEVGVKLDDLLHREAKL